MELIWNQPLSVQTAIFYQWLETLSIARLDSALCNKDLRPKFLAHVKFGKHGSLHVGANRPGKQLLSWLALRKAKVSKFISPPDQFDRQIATCAEHNANVDFLIANYRCVNWILRNPEWTVVKLRIEMPILAVVQFLGFLCLGHCANLRDMVLGSFSTSPVGEFKRCGHFAMELMATRSFESYFFSSQLFSVSCARLSNKIVLKTSFDDELSGFLTRKWSDPSKVLELSCGVKGRYLVPVGEVEPFLIQHQQMDFQKPADIARAVGTCKYLTYAYIPYSISKRFEFNVLERKMSLTLHSQARQLMDPDTWSELLRALQEHKVALNCVEFSCTSTYPGQIEQLYISLPDIRSFLKVDQDTKDDTVLQGAQFFSQLTAVCLIEKSGLPVMHAFLRESGSKHCLATLDIQESILTADMAELLLSEYPALTHLTVGRSTAIPQLQKLFVKCTEVRAMNGLTVSKRKICLDVDLKFHRNRDYLALLSTPEHTADVTCSCDLDVCATFQSQTEHLHAVRKLVWYGFGCCNDPSRGEDVLRLFPQLEHLHLEDAFEINFSKRTAVFKGSRYLERKHWAHYEEALRRLETVELRHCIYVSMLPQLADEMELVSFPQAAHIVLDCGTLAGVDAMFSLRTVKSISIGKLFTLPATDVLCKCTQLRRLQWVVEHKQTIDKAVITACIAANPSLHSLILVAGNLSENDFNCVMRKGMDIQVKKSTTPQINGSLTELFYYLH